MCRLMDVIVDCMFASGVTLILHLESIFQWIHNVMITSLIHSQLCSHQGQGLL